MPIDHRFVEWGRRSGKHERVNEDIWEDVEGLTLDGYCERPADDSSSSPDSSRMGDSTGSAVLELSTVAFLVWADLPLLAREALTAVNTPA